MRYRYHLQGAVPPTRAVCRNLEAPKVSVEGLCTLVSSAEKNNHWFKEDGTPVEGATEQKFTPTEDGIYYVAVSNGSCFSDPSQAYRVQVSDQYALNMNLAKGWNWISSNLSDEGFQKVKDFIKPIENKVERLVGFDSELIRDPQLGLTGDLITLAPSASFLMQTNSVVDNTWTGHAYKPEVTTVNLKKGWNWISYQPIYENSLEKSLEALVPSEGDIIKNYTQFATYSGGKWEGTLTTMAPGIGYMYYSGQSKSFHYTMQRVFPVEANAKKMAMAETAFPWHFDSHKYPYNMNLIAVVQADGNIAPAGLFTVGAFVGDECRGVGQYVGDKLYMTIYGDVNMSTNLTFKAIENSSQQEYDIVETVKFSNTLLGSVSSPYKLTISGATGVNKIVDKGDYNIYPNPVRNTLYVNGDLESLNSVYVIGNNGVIVAKTDNYSENGLNISSLIEGTYIVVLKTSAGSVVKRILKVN